MQVISGLSRCSPREGPFEENGKKRSEEGEAGAGDGARLGSASAVHLQSN